MQIPARAVSRAGIFVGNGGNLIQGVPPGARLPDLAPVLVVCLYHKAGRLP